MSYKDLKSYQQAEEIFDLNMKFCEEFLGERKDARFREQSEQAARSGKQNIAEGAKQGVGLKGYIYLLGIARGSLEELLEDYKDFARVRGLEVWPRGDGRVEGVKKVDRGKRVKFLFPPQPSQPSQPSLTLIVNYLIDLITRTNYLLDRQKKSLEEKLVKEGDYNEKLRWKREEQKKKEIVSRFWRKFQ